MDRKLYIPSAFNPSCVLLKPHGSINWFRYKDIAWDDNEYHSCEPLTKEEEEGTGLFFFENLIDHPINMRLDIGYAFEPRLKKPPELDIVPPGENSRNRRNYVLLKEKMKNFVAEAEKVTIIGFAMKETDADSRKLFQEARNNSSRSIEIHIVNKAIEDEASLRSSDSPPRRAWPPSHSESPHGARHAWTRPAPCARTSQLSPLATTR